MTHPDAPPVEPTCPTCGHPAHLHGLGCYHGTENPDPALHCLCNNRDRDVYALALTAATAEIARLKAANEHWHVRVTSLLDERDALARDAERLDWLDKHMTEAGDRTVRIEASEFDRTFRIYGTPQKIVGHTLREAVDAARSAAPTTTEPENG